MRAGHKPSTRYYTEETWTNLDGRDVNGYTKSKVRHGIRLWPTSAAFLAFHLLSFPVQVSPTCREWVCIGLVLPLIFDPDL